MERISQALSQVAADGDKLMKGDSEAREKLVTSARKLVVAAEIPVETLLWTIWALVRAPLFWCQVADMLTQANIADPNCNHTHCHRLEDLRNSRTRWRPASD